MNEVISRSERESEFREALSRFLRERNAEIEVNENNEIDVWLDGIYDSEGNTIKEYANFSLGRLSR